MDQNNGWDSFHCELVWGVSGLIASPFRCWPHSRIYRLSGEVGMSTKLLKKKTFVDSFNKESQFSQFRLIWRWQSLKRGYPNLNCNMLSNKWTRNVSSFLALLSLLKNPLSDLGLQNKCQIPSPVTSKAFKVFMSGDQTKLQKKVTVKWRYR